MVKCLHQMQMDGESNVTVLDLKLYRIIKSIIISWNECIYKWHFHTPNSTVFVCWYNWMYETRCQAFS